VPAGRRIPVVAIDDDSKLTLALTVGVGAVSAASLAPLLRDMLEERMLLALAGYAGVVDWRP
jgi:hypothetical protein